MKKIALGILLLLTLSIVGCKIDDKHQQLCNANSCSSSSFNQETYVWESFIFNTNSTSRTNR